MCVLNGSVNGTSMAARMGATRTAKDGVRGTRAMGR